MRVEHPDGTTDDYVDVNGDLVPVDDEGCFDAPETWVETFAERHGTTVDAVRVADTCDTVKSDGEVCGRERPCPYHDEED